MGCLTETSGFISFSGPLSLYTSKLELVTCLCSEAVYGQNYCVPIFQAEEFEFLQNSARTEFLKNCKYCKYIVISVCSEERIILFNYCLFLREYVMFIYLYFLYKLKT